MNTEKIISQLHDSGFHVIPSGRGKSGKQPLASWKKYQEQQPTKEELGRWLDSLKPTKWGIVTNERVAVIDADTLEARAKLEGMIGQPNVATPRGGAHWYVDTTGHPLKTRTGCMVGVDVRGVGGFVNIVGKGYEILTLPAPGALIPYEALPDEIKNSLNGRSEANKPIEEPGAIVPEGKRNSKLLSLAGAMRIKGMAQAEIEIALMKVNETRCRPPLSEDEVRGIVKSVCKYKPADNAKLTDTGNAELMAELYGEKLRFDHKKQRWLIWKDHYWRPDRKQEVSPLAIKAARTLYAQAAAIEDQHRKGQVAGWAISSESRAKIDACLSLARRIPPFADNGVDWDRSTMLLGAENGIIDLRTGELRPGKPEDRITMSVGLGFDPDARCPRWEQFMGEVFDDDDLVDWLWRALGYSITGDTTEHIILMGYGEGANGKSRFFNAINGSLGNYAHVSPFSTFSLPTPSSSNDLAALELKRFVTSSETNAGTRLNTERLKALSGEDSISARFLYKEFETFEPHAKVWLFVNHRPEINDDTIATWRRVRLIPFTQTFIKEKADNKLGEKLRSEAPGILAWLVRGCLEWQKRGLAPVPECIRQATKDYRKYTDLVLGFIEEQCVLGEGYEVRAGQFYETFREWAKGERKIPSQVVIGQRIMSMNFDKKEKASGYYYQGLKLKSAVFNNGRIKVNLSGIGGEW